MAKLAMYAKDVRPDSGVDSVILNDPERSECECGIVLTDVLQELSALWCQAEEQLLQGVRRILQRLELNLAMSTA